ncbi:Zinc metalloproteinase nas-4 [Pseudolycoriella hygida]|uniref:Metalloendopeptidase n=1 Tax=Pseudolycoriella hygida TaxID=35572 RepID=A0A9Q0N0P6_9DIPT|nr:Zinc metalloproteinase nas-4 [Pseudolycoriella hygida]
MVLKKHIIFVALVVFAVSMNFALALPLDGYSSFSSREEDEPCEIIVSDAEKQERLLMRNGMVQTMYRWPNNTVVYNMDSPPFDAAEKDLVERSLKTIEQVTCVKFLKRTNEDFYVNLTANSGCSSQVGYQGRLQNGPQRLNLSKSGCFSLGTIVHEFLHALGFYHMQSASNRDDFVTIKWENIQTGKEHNFEKYGANVITDFGISYDYLSVMHYSAYAFSSNKEATIEPQDLAYKNLIGQRNGLSEKDIAKINIMYNCPE